MRGFTVSREFSTELAKTLAGYGLKTQGAQFERIVAWLASLRLLNGVPSWYLVPDGRMLPSESIRFFQVDENWISCLIDGAFTIGTSTAGDRKRQAEILPELMKKIAEKARALRAEKFGEPGPASEGRASGTSVMGFLLRSAVVAGWPGMTVLAWSGDELVRKVRFEEVAPDILLCLFDRQIDKLVFSEPVEILHFGVDEADSTATSYTKTLRYVTSSDPAIAPGTQMSVEVNVPMSNKRVVDVTSFAGQIQSALLANGGIEASDTYTSAEFALELTVGVQQVTFTLDGGAQ